MTNFLSPFVYWAQTKKTVSLRIDLRNVTAPEINLSENDIDFTASGIGAKGENEYSFFLDFYKPVNPDGSQYRIMERCVEFSIEKKKEDWWPRLTLEQKKLVWLKVDFDKLQTEDDDELEEEEEPEPVHTNPLGSYRDMLERGPRKKKKGSKVEEFRKIYLFLYNLFQFVGFLYALIVLTIRYAKEGPDSLQGTYEAISRPIKFCHILQLLEIIHPLLGYTPGSPLLPFLQVGGRLFMIFAMIDCEPRMQTKPVVFYLFLVYSMIEVIRYPYYMLAVYKANIGLLTWLRYTLWIPLYPLGFLCEGVIILRNIPYFEETKKFSMELPNHWNFSLYFPHVLRVYLLVGFFPLLYCFMTSMYRKRVQKIGPKSWKGKKAE